MLITASTRTVQFDAMHDIVADQLKLSAAVQMRQVLFRSRQKIVQRDDVVSLLQ